MKKRSVTIAGHPTSVSLEQEFWDHLGVIAARENLSINALITDIDTSKTGQNLSSAIRVFVLKDIQSSVIASD